MIKRNSGLIVFILVVLIGSIWIILSEDKVEKNKPQEVYSEELLKEELVISAQVTLNLGLYNLEYFADRMVYKASKVGAMAIKKNIGTKSSPLYKVYIENISKEEAEEIQKNLLKIVPDLKSNIKGKKISFLLR